MGTGVQGRADEDPGLPRRRLADLLDGVAPDRLGERLVAEAQRLAGAPAALYVVEVEGRYLVRVAGRDGFPRQLTIPHTVGLELTRETEAGMRAVVVDRLGPDALVQPLWIGPRAQVVVVAERGEPGSLAPLAHVGGAAVDLANRCTDVFHRARRIRRAQAAAELQKDLLPPSVGVVEGAQLAIAILPAYEVGGDFCDWVQNPGETRLAIGDAVGKGGRAMAVSALALGALRSSRRCRDTLAETARAVDGEIRALGSAEQYLTAVLARWEPRSGVVEWLRLGHPPPLLVDTAGRVSELDSAGHLPLGLLDPDEPLEVRTHPLAPNEQFVLYSDGVTERRIERGGRFGLAGVQRALDEESGATATAAGTVRTILHAVRAAASDPPSDDASLVSLRRQGR